MTDFDERYECYKNMVESRLDQLLAENDSNVLKAMRYSTLGGGKRVRAVLCLSACEACGGAAEDAIDAACALEMIHAYSLIHDDLPCMDDDDMRRGKPSCHKAFGEANALLAGDGLLTRAFGVLAGLEDASKARDCVATLSNAAGYLGMIGGQELDLYYETVSATAEELNELHAKKTGALICASVELGAICAGASINQRNALSNYASGVGLVFQITDDILDVTSSNEHLGKPVGSDAQSGKTTYYTLYGEKRSLELAAEINSRALAALNAEFKNAAFLNELANRLLKRNY